jgi:hypothetical protein
MSISAELSWFDRLREDSGVPASLDLDGATLAHNAVSGDNLSQHTYRRRPVPYIILGRSRRYNVRDVVAYAKRCVEEAPVRIPPQRPRGKRVRPATPDPTRSPPDAAVRQHESGDQREKVPEATS